MSREGQRSNATLLHTAGRPNDVQAVATSAVNTWRTMDAALSPIIGKLGFAALYRRCVYLRREADPGLAAAHERVFATDDFAALHVALCQQGAAEAAATQAALEQTFHDLLVSLIGEPLTTRLLRPIRDATSGPTGQQDTSP